jgi:hypothetical protein
MVILPHRRKAFRVSPESGGGGGDPYFNQVVLSLHMNGANGGTSFPDSSNSSHAITAVGNAQTSTAQAKFNGSSGLFDGVGDFLTMPHSDDFNFGTGDWTIEFFLRFNSLSSYQTIYEHGYISAGGLLVQTNLNTGKFVVYTSGVSRAVETSTAPSVGVWYYYAIVQSGGVITIYRDGVYAGSGSNSVDLTITAAAAVGARASDSLYGINGNVAEFRITKGGARYTSNFTPPTEAFPDFLDESVDPHFARVVWLLHCETSAFIDSSPAGRTPTFNNSPSASTPAKFGSAAYQANSSSIISAASSDFTFGTGDFTVEMWIRFPSGVFTGSAATYGRTLFDCRPGAINGPYMAGGISTSRIFQISLGTSGAGIVTLFSSSALAVDTWYHVAVTRSGTSAKLFIDGVTHDAKTSSLNILNDRFVLAYNQFLAGIGWIGGIDELRITKGVARYTSNFTPLTEAFPDFLDESVDPYFNQVVLLLHCDGTDGSTTFTDSSNSAKTVTESGTAQVDTAFQKFGTASLLLEASTANYLSIAGHADFALNADFTIEFFYRPAATAHTQAMIDIGGGLSGISIRANQAGGVEQLFIAFKGAQYNLYCTWTVGAWHHVAVVRSGSTIRGYVNGTQVGSNLTNSGTFTSATPAVRIGGVLEGAAFAQLRNLDDIRITKGFARYTSNFTPPTRAFADS